MQKIASHKKQYALYKGESCLCIGTIVQIARIRGVKKQTIKYYRMPTYQKRISKSPHPENRLTLVGLD